MEQNDYKKSNIGSCFNIPQFVQKIIAPSKANPNDLLKKSKIPNGNLRQQRKMSDIELHSVE